MTKAPAPPITRSEAASDALASARIEGQLVDHDTIDILTRWASGEVSDDDLDASCERLVREATDSRT
jgi:hypothetical protein